MWLLQYPVLLRAQHHHPSPPQVPPQFLPLSGLYLQVLSPLLGESAQAVPLVTDALAALVDGGGIMVVQLTGGEEQRRDKREGGKERDL